MKSFSLIFILFVSPLVSGQIRVTDNRLPTVTLELENTGSDTIYLVNPLRYFVMLQEDRVIEVRSSNLEVTDSIVTVFFNIDPAHTAQYPSGTPFLIPLPPQSRSSVTLFFALTFRERRKLKGKKIRIKYLMMNPNGEIIEKYTQF